MSEKGMKLYDIPIETIKWWHKILLFFAPKHITADVGKDKTIFCLSKKMFGKLYLVKMWEEETKVGGLKFDYIVYDEDR